jgi:hypothetical protein
MTWSDSIIWTHFYSKLRASVSRARFQIAGTCFLPVGKKHRVIRVGTVA